MEISSLSKQHQNASKLSRSTGSSPAPNGCLFPQAFRPRKAHAERFWGWAVSAKVPIDACCNCVFCCSFFFVVVDLSNSIGNLSREKALNYRLRNFLVICTDIWFYRFYHIFFLFLQNLAILDHLADFQTHTLAEERSKMPSWMLKIHGIRNSWCILL